MKKRTLLGCLIAPWLFACATIPNCRACSNTGSAPGPSVVAPPPAPRVGDALLDHLPADVDGVADLDLRGMRTSPLLGRIVGAGPQAQVPDFVRTCGFNPLARVQRASVGVRFPSRGDSDFVFVIESDIREDEMVQCLTGMLGRPLSATIQGTRRLWQTSNREFVLVVASPGLILAGTRALVERTLEVTDGSFPSARTNARLSGTLARVDAGHTIRVAMLLDERVRRATDLESAPDMAGVVAFAIGASIGTDVHGSSIATYDSAARAAAAGVLSAAEMMRRLSSFEIPPGEVQLGESVQNADLELTFAISGDGVLGAMSRARGRNPASR